MPDDIVQRTVRSRCPDRCNQIREAMPLALRICSRVNASAYGTGLSRLPDGFFGWSLVFLARARRSRSYRAFVDLQRSQRQPLP